MPSCPFYHGGLVLLQTVVHKIQGRHQPETRELRSVSYFAGEFSWWSLLLILLSRCVCMWGGRANKTQQRNHTHVCRGGQNKTQQRNHIIRSILYAVACTYACTQVYRGRSTATMLGDGPSLAHQGFYWPERTHNIYQATRYYTYY